MAIAAEKARCRQIFPTHGCVSDRSCNRIGEVTTGGQATRAVQSRIKPRFGKNKKNLTKSKSKSRMASTRGFEPPTPGFIPLRLSPPLARSWSGLSLHHWPQAFRCCPSSLYTFAGSSPALGSGLACHCGKRSPTLSRSVMEFPAITPNFRNPVLYPAELRGHEERRSLPDPFNQKWR